MRARSLIVSALALSLLAMDSHAQTAPPSAAPQPIAAYSAVPPPAPPATGRVAVDTAPGYARILFTFDRPAPVTASIADGVLMLRLSQTVDTNIDNLTENLGAYVSTGRRDPDGLTYRFALKNPVALHNSTQGNQTAVDLVPGSFEGVPPNLPAPPPPPPPTVKRKLPDLTNLPVIRLRVSEYANFTRLVFDWPAPVNYTAYPGQGRISLRFEAPAKPDFAMLETRRPAWVKSAGWHLDGAVTVVEFETDGESAFHDFREGNRIAIDVLAPKTDAAAYALAGATGSELKLTPVPPASNPPLKGSDAAAALQAGAPAVVTPAPVAPPAPVVAESPNPSAELTRDGAALHFPDARGHAAALFTRGETLWIVLDAHPMLDAATLLAPLATILAKAEADQAYGAAVLKLVFKTPLLPSLQEGAAALTVSLTSGAATPPDAIAFTRQGADGQTNLTTPLPGAVHVIPLADPEAGDRFFVVPGRPGRGVLTPKLFVEMEALPTAAGVAIVPFTDDLAVEVQSETVTVSRPKGLALSAASGASTAPVVQMPAAKQGPAFIDFAQWTKGPSGNVLVAERNLRAAVARLPESEGNSARLKLARYLLAHGLASEALGEIQLIQASDPKLANDPGLAVMKGAAQYMMGRYADARLSLSAGALDADPHAALWRGMAEAELGDFANARRDLAAAQSVLRFYPEGWQTRARLARAETGIAQGDLASANDALDQLSPQLAPRDSVEARLYEAQLLAAQGHVNEAIVRLRTLERTDYAPIAARASFARVETELAAKKIKPTDAIGALEQLRYRWRGDDLELKTLRKLGSLYFAQQSWREGLGVLRVAALNFPASELARDAQDDMRRAYTDLFLGGKVDVMRPVDALAMFYDFIELTPIGRDGDEMIRRLSDRLVAVDLLGPAARLLDHQVKERLDGVARAAVATKLALIYLLDQNPKEALAIINDTRQTRLPDELNGQRRLLEARALSGLKQFEAAIDLIADDDTQEAKRLRGDIYWDSSNWTLAGAKTEDLLGDRWNLSGPLSDTERGQIMRAAVAYSLAGDEAALALLRERYEAKMKASPDAKAFAIVTERIDRQGVAFRDLAKQIASVDSLQAFMEEFKKRGVSEKRVAKSE